MVAAIIEVLEYNTATMHVGFTIALLFMHEDREHNMAHIDSLIRLENRRLLDIRKQEIIKKNSGCNLTVVMMDINRFKEVNDLHGHLVGDQILRDVADIFKNEADNIPNIYNLCRYGGDEFIIVAKEVEDVNIINFKERAEEKLQLKGEEYNLEFPLQISIGVATNYCNDVQSFNKLIHEADDNMYEDKHYKKAVFNSQA